MKKILIADDKATSRELLRTVLERQGYEVMEAADGEEALQKALAELPDLILLDLQMPRRTGYEVLGELR
jgi:CheY-like chemotaxis protein